MRRWVRVPCRSCEGAGVELTLLDGSIPCGSCGGARFLYLTCKGRLAVSPGGEFRGSWPGRWQRTGPGRPRKKVRMPQGKKKGRRPTLRGLWGMLKPDAVDGAP